MGAEAFGARRRGAVFTGDGLLLLIQAPWSNRKGSARDVSGRSMHDDLPPVNDEEPLVDPATEAVRGRLHDLKQQHQDLDAAIQALEQSTRLDQLQIARLKKQKLSLRDQIVKLEDQLTPDIIA